MFTLQEIEAIVKKAIGTINFAKEPRNLYEPLEYMISIGGKRLRPRLCLTTFNLFSNQLSDDVLYPALALEIFHTFTLIHDDIMDKADTRRGMPTVHCRWGDNSAILSGDVMSIMAYQMMGAYKGANHASVLELFSKTAAEVCEGQQYDMDFEDLPLITMDEYLKMIGLKTAVLIACSAKMGALIAGATSAQADALYNFGYQLGMAFQITDDYLDTFGDASVFGKKIGGDIENNKKTWLLVECLRLAAGNDKAELDSLIKMNDNLPKKVEDVRNLYLRLGIDKAALRAIEVYHDKAMQTLKEAGFNAEQIAYLADMAKEMVYREY